MALNTSYNKNYELYKEHLSTIKGLKFTFREIDILVCIVHNRGEKKIASLLSISPRTVSVHVYNAMNKLGCNTKDQIIDFMESSGKLPLVREYYLHLLLKANFEKQLTNIASKMNQSGMTCYCYRNDALSLDDDFYQSIQKHLTMARIKLLEIAPDENNSPIFELKNVTEAGYYRELLKSLLEVINPPQKEQVMGEFDEACQTIENIQEGKAEVVDEIDNKNLSGNNQGNSFLFKKATLKTKKLEKSIFKACFDFTNRKVAFVLITLGTILALILIAPHHSNRQEQETFSISSDFSIPTESVLLPRSALIEQIDKNFKKSEGIQVVVLSGIGGAGKTILARQYARLKKFPLIWEIDAETTGGLYTSFEKLGSALSTTEKDQKILRGLLDIKNTTEKTEKLINFVKGRLKLHSPWFLIFDNVENFSDIQKYFPQDAKSWGQGKIILTTRNINIQNNNLVNHVIPMGELTSKQKQELFTKIMNAEKSYANKSREISVFLEHIPPFPLDVSVAAYYLKSTNIPYEQYIEKLHNYTKETNELHKHILKEAGEYTKTRYAIITHSLEHLINTHKDFAELLLFISLLDSQNIPKSLLDQFKDSNLVDNFIYHLKKHSLLTAETLPSSLGAMYSIHRSTQEISLSYLLGQLKLNTDSPILQKISYVLDDYADKTIEKEDFPKMHITAHHIEKMLEHSLLTNFSKGLLGSKLGSLYYFVSNERSKSTIADSLNILNDSKNFENLSSADRPRLARALLNIGNVYNELRFDRQAQALFEKVVNIYGEKGLKNYAELSWALSHLGNVHRRLRNYEKAKDYLEESVRLNKQYGLNKKRMARTLAYLGGAYRGLVGCHQNAINSLEASLVLYKKNYPNEHFRIGWILTQLGNLYRDSGDSKKAKKYLEMSFLICKKNLHENHIHMGLTLAYLGNCYRDLGEHEKSRNFLERSLKIHQTHFDEHHLRMGWILFHLANTYKAMGNHQGAQKLFDKVFDIYANHHGEENVERACLLRDMAAICLEKNRLDDAEKFIKKSLKIFNRHNHIDIYQSLEVLGEFYLKKSIQSSHDKNTQEGQKLKNIAIDVFNQALKITEQNFPKNSVHIERIHSKVKHLQDHNI